MSEPISTSEEAPISPTWEAPTSAAQLQLLGQPVTAWWEASGPGGLSGKGGGSFPPSETPLVVKTFGITVMGLGGIAGFVLTMQLALAHAEGWALALSEL